MDNANEAAHKKRKLSDDIEQPSAPSGSGEEQNSAIERGSVWMDDGNIILQADQTQFRVHKSILSGSSSVFKDMFSIPQPTNSCLTEVEGCAVVHLHDSAKVAYLLTVIYNHQYTTHPIRPECTSIDKLSTLLRLANKYDVPSVQENMRIRIVTEFPNSFERYLCRQKCNYLDICDGADILNVVNLLHEEGVFTGLPLALYYAIVHCTIDEICHGAQDIGGLARATLSAPLVAVCMVGKGKLEDFMWDESHAWLREFAVQSFCGKDPCREVFRAVAQQILRPNPNLSYALDLDWDEVMIMGPPRDPELCGICEKGAKKQHQKGRKAVFQQLPSIFGYGSWDEVKKMDHYQL